MPSPARREFERLSEPAIRKVLKTLRTSLKKMRGVKTGTDFDLFAARQKVQAMSREIDSLEVELSSRLGQAAREVVPIADALNPEAPANLVGIDANLVASAEADAARFVRNITDRIRSDINAATVAGVSGELDRAGFEGAIAKALDVDKNEARVERIARTELGKVFEDQGTEADKRLAEQGADLIKVWSHKCGGRQCFGARIEHVALHGQERELWEDFNVGQGATKSTPPDGPGYRAARPLAASLPAKHVIHCGCTAIRKPRSQAKQPYTSKTRPAEARGAMRV